MTKLKIINADNISAEEHIITSVVSSVISFNRIGSFSEEEKLSRKKKQKLISRVCGSDDDDDAAE